MHSRVIFVVSGVGLLLALVSAYLFSQQPKALPPVFEPAANPYGSGIYANGIIESDQSQGANVNIYPEVSGPVTRISAAEGQRVRKGDVILTIDDAVQRATTEQLKSQAEAALAVLKELKAQPRPETLAVAAAQVDNAEATLRSARDQLAKQQQSFDLDPRSVSRDALDNAHNAEHVAATNLEVVRRQFELTRAGAWSYDIQNQERQYAALSQAAAAATALLGKYTIRAPADGVVLAITAAEGGYVSPQGAYETYTQGLSPLVVMGAPQSHLEVRAYIDEILVHELPEPGQMRARLFVRGTNVSLPLTFARMQPYISPKIELSDQRQERVDLRVLPLIFRFENQPALKLYPGLLVDVYIAAK